MNKDKLHVMLIMISSICILFATIYIVEYLDKPAEKKFCNTNAGIHSFKPSKVVKSYSDQDTTESLNMISVDVYQRRIYLNKLKYDILDVSDHERSLLYIIDNFGVSVIWLHIETGIIQIDSMNGVKTYYLP